jgi:PAS domain S-box-containing protein
MGMSDSEKLILAKDFLSQAEPFCVSQLFEFLDDTYFFVKNTKGQFIKANKAFLKLFGYDKLQDVTGLTDYDMVTRELAVRYEMDDRRVWAGEKICNLSEPVSSKGGIISLHVSTKLPVRNCQGEIIGLIGITRDTLKTLDAITPLQKFQAALDIIEKNYHTNIKLDDLAKAVFMSNSTFLRGFKKQFAMTPGNYIKQVRYKVACRLLIESALSISEIALDTGFSDQSHFTREFKKSSGVTPKAYREKFK